MICTNYKFFMIPLALGFAVSVCGATAALAHGDILDDHMDSGVLLADSQSALKAEREAERDAFEKRAQEKDAMRDVQFRARYDELKARLGTMQDTRKVEIADRLMQNMNRVNGVLTGNYVAYLVKLDMALDRVEDKMLKLVDRGTDITSVASAIQRARIAIIDVREKVIAQKEKVYTVNISSEDKLQAVFRGSIQGMRVDHHTIRESLRQVAHAAVKDAIQALKQIVEKSQANQPASSTTVENTNQ